MDSMKKIIKWAVYTFAAFCVFCLLVATCSDDEKEGSNQTSTEQKEDIKEQSEVNESKRVEEKKEVEITGTYEVTDKVGCTIRITLNEDETATITGVKGENITYYCSWQDVSWRNAGIKISFSDEKPYLVYEGGADENTYQELYIKDGWMYTGYSNADSKNPKWRLKVTKIK